MLVLSRQQDESIELVIPPSTETRRVTVTIKRIDSTRVRIGTEAPRDIAIHRAEVLAAGTPIPTWPAVTVADEVSLEIAKRRLGAA